MTIKELTEMVESIGKCKVEWEGYRAYHTETGRLVAEYNPRTGRLIMKGDGEDEKDNLIEEVANSNPEQTEAPAPAPVTKTSGVFKVVTDRNPSFYYVGASSQIEIAFRDYMNWVAKGKAPKAIQEEADRHNRNPEIFRFEVLEEMEGSRAELNERKKKWIERLANNQPETVEEGMKIKMKELKGTPRQIKFANKIKEVTLEIVERLPQAIQQYSKHDAMREKYMRKFVEVKNLFENYRVAGDFIEDWKGVIYTDNKAERVGIITDKLEEKGIKITWRIISKLQEEYITY